MTNIAEAELGAILHAPTRLRTRVVPALGDAVIDLADRAAGRRNRTWGWAEVASLGHPGQDGRPGEAQAGQHQATIRLALDVGFPRFDAVVQLNLPRLKGKKISPRRHRARVFPETCATLTIPCSGLQGNLALLSGTSDGLSRHPRLISINKWRILIDIGVGYRLCLGTGNNPTGLTSPGRSPALPRQKSSFSWAPVSSSARSSTSQPRALTKSPSRS